VLLGSLTRPELIFRGLPSADRMEVLRTLAERIARLGLVKDKGALVQKLLEREQLGSTGVGAGVAIPHCKLPGLRQGIVAVGLAPGGVDFGAADGEPVKLFFVVLSPAAAPAEHLQVLAAISRWIRADRHAERILELDDPQAVYEFLQEEGG
jgi:mannitol/fructose-specific phosphotransferase system IIA component (Ntr-type)